MRRISKKKSARDAEVAEFRGLFRWRVCRCETCGYDPNRRGQSFSFRRLHIHEIARGAIRAHALDKPYAILRVCSDCHPDRLHDRAAWPDARQLAALKRSRPEDYDLRLFNLLVNPNAPRRVTEQEVEKWI